LPNNNGQQIGIISHKELGLLNFLKLIEGTNGVPGNYPAIQIQIHPEVSGQIKS
jgi:hypothetical protein